MAFYIRKAFRLGPVRLNLSKSGLGVSVGVKGARISTGPAGTQFHAGRHGLYYRKRLRLPTGSPDIGSKPTGSADTQPLRVKQGVLGTRLPYAGSADTSQEQKPTAGGGLLLLIALAVVLVFLFFGR